MKNWRARIYGAVISIVLRYSLDHDLCLSLFLSLHFADVEVGEA